MLGSEALDRFLGYGFQDVLDVGSGAGRHAAIMREDGMRVAELNWPCDYMDWAGRYDAIWCCHVLEHVSNIGAFLGKMADECEVLCVTVPPAKHNIVGGHLSTWNEGLLLYNLVMAGIDCSMARVGVYGYNISVLVEVERFDLPELHRDRGDLELLQDYFPVSIPQNTDGRLGNINW